MAIIPKDLYPGQTVGSDPDYPHGKAQNVTVAGDGTGTPFEKEWLNDAWGFFQALLAEAEIDPSGDPDKVGASQYLQALQALFPDIDRVDTLESEVSDLQLFQGSAEDRLDRVEGRLGGADGSGEFLYTDADGAAAPKTRTVILSPLGGVSGISGADMAIWGLASSNDSYMSGFTDSGWIGFSLDWLPDGATLTRVRALVDPGVPRAGSARMSLKVQKRTVSFSGPSAGSTVDVAEVFDNAGGALQVIDSGMLSETVDKAGGKILVARVKAGNTASSNSDALYAIEVTFTDPGPRNV